MTRRATPNDREVTITCQQTDACWQKMKKLRKTRNVTWQRRRKHYRKYMKYLRVAKHCVHQTQDDKGNQRHTRFTSLSRKCLGNQTQAQTNNRQVGDADSRMSHSLYQWRPSPRRTTIFLPYETLLISTLISVKNKI